MRCLLLWGEFLKAFLKIAQTAFQKHSSEHGWSAWWKHSRPGVADSVISVMDADGLMFIYLQESSVTLTTIKMITLASLWLITTLPTTPPHLKLEHFKMLHLPLPPMPISIPLALNWIRLWNDSWAAPSPSLRAVHRGLSMDRGLIQMLCQYVPVSTASAV